MADAGPPSSSGSTPTACPVPTLVGEINGNTIEPVADGFAGKPPGVAHTPPGISLRPRLICYSLPARTGAATPRSEPSRCRSRYCPNIHVSPQSQPPL